MRILTVYAHPDDESFGPAAALAKYARRGATIAGLWLTRGEQGKTSLKPEPSPSELARLRERDLREAAALIGYQQVDLLDYEDGTLAEVPVAGLERVVLDAIRLVQPDVVVTFGPGGITRHPDHLAIHRAAAAMFHQARAEGFGVRELYYDAVSPDRAQEMNLASLPDGQPNTWIDVSETWRIKLEALHLHARSVVDAAKRAKQLEQEPQMVATFHRAWPPVPPDQRVTEFLSTVEP